MAGTAAFTFGSGYGNPGAADLAAAVTEEDKRRSRLTDFLVRVGGHR
jgi:hypothetical protein